jgi:hypothetical protein
MRQMADLVTPPLCSTVWPQNTCFSMLTIRIRFLLYFRQFTRGAGVVLNISTYYSILAKQGENPATIGQIAYFVSYPPCFKIDLCKSTKEFIKKSSKQVKPNNKKKKIMKKWAPAGLEPMALEKSGQK